MTGENLEINTEIETEIPVLETVIDNGNDWNKFASDTVIDTENTEFDAFLFESSAPDFNEVKAAADEKIEKITQTAAKSLVIQGANGLMMFASTITKTDLKISPFEIESLADDLAPCVVKYGNDIADAPPWLKTLFKYRVELIALKGIVLFAVTVYLKFKDQKRLQLEAETAAKKERLKERSELSEAA
ncbi:hypothetical protein [Shewanella psychrotolerans]|uniref:hypothetical protein n=1 Tax=Shewanella psychrotolerans TaxID=2864206 RepID=UPI001C65BB1F|nr:hypothetical protein [Shewanella psychrotolerans]QYK03134.1 hypothetical protein K0I62_09540 [Shewanella psychrotolerans]